MFVDKVLVHVKAGRGGDGAVSFRHEKYIDKGGPDGGNGGRGGDIIFVATESENTLIHFRYKQELVADSGMPGSRRRQYGRSGVDLKVKVPVGTQVFEGDTLIADLTSPGQEAIVAKGGEGGFGNAHFKSSTRQTPQVAEIGAKGEEKELTLELKLLADVGLVGFPNAGKSTFLSVVSNARPEIGDYPFTTLIPNLGVADIDSTTLLIADIPGLIEGASKGKGLGDAFLRHVERTAVLIHLIDIYEQDVAKAYQTIMGELKAHNAGLAQRPQVVALTKVEGLPDDAIAQQVKALKKVVAKSTPVMAISSQAHIGVTELLRAVNKMVIQTRQAAELTPDDDPALPVVSLTQKQEELAWQVKRRDDGAFMVTGHKIEKFASRTNFDSEPGRRRLRDIMRKMGIMHELERQKIKEGNQILIGSRGEYRLTYGVY